MSSARILIVEDQSLIAADLASMLRRNGMEVVGTVRTGEEAVSAMENTSPDLILMDIHLAGSLDGVSAAALINRRRKVPVVYLSDHSDSQTVNRAKLTFPVSYMTKPFKEPDLVRTVEIALFNSKQIGSEDQSDEILFVKDKGQLIRLDRNKFLCLQAGRSYCEVVLEDDVIILSTSLNHVLDQLHDSDVVRVHRSYAVNIRKVTAIDGNVLKIGSKEIQMGKEYREKFMERINVLK